MQYPRRPDSSRGFSLIEVMVALIVISVGLLGIAKMQALALSNTGNSRVRALAALEAASLASTMQADRQYWSVVPLTTTPFTVTIAGATITGASDTVLTSTPTCTGGTVCAVDSMAAFDLLNWAGAMAAIVPNDQVTISCAAPVATGQVACSITVSWNENLVNSNSAQQNSAAATAALATPQYTLVVQP